MKKKTEKIGSVAQQICDAADTLYGETMYMTSPVVPDSAHDCVQPPATQNEADTRAWVMEHQT